MVFPLPVHEWNAVPPAPGSRAIVRRPHRIGSHSSIIHLTGDPCSLYKLKGGLFSRVHTERDGKALCAGFVDARPRAAWNAPEGCRGPMTVPGLPEHYHAAVPTPAEGRRAPSRGAGFNRDAGERWEPDSGGLPMGGEMAGHLGELGGFAS